MQTPCPCCGWADTTFTMPKVDLELNEVSFLNGRVKVSPRVAETIAALAKDYGKSVAKERLYIRIFGDVDELTDPQNSLTGYIMKSRRALSRLGLEIKTERAFGYRLRVAS